MPRDLAVLRVVDELLWALRRAGFEISTAQAIDAVSALARVGLDDPWTTREAIRAFVVHDARDGARFEREFERFFSGGRPRRTLEERLLAAGVSSDEMSSLGDVFSAMRGGEHDLPLGPILGPGPDLDRLLALGDSARILDGMQDASQRGFFTHKLLSSTGVSGARDSLARVRAWLVEVHGAERADAIVRLLELEIAAAEDDVRRHVTELSDRRAAAALAAREARTIETTPFAELSIAEAEAVRRAVVRFVERLAGRARVRRRRARKGKIDPHATWRLAARTNMVPVELVTRGRKRDRPRLIVLCDISDSVRAAARFLLEFAYHSQILTERTRTFVFVSDVGETTSLFAAEPLPVALAGAWGGHVISIADNSNYGRVLRTFEARWLREVDRRTTVVILGDGRTNYQGDEANILDRVRARAKALYWLCPEPRATWSVGDSAMSRYAPRCTKVLQVDTAAALFAGARAFLS